MAVCSYCKSTLVRQGDALVRIGQSAELFDDHSPLALGARGRHQGEPFSLVGRVQIAYGTLAAGGGAATDEAGRWSEWHALFDNGRSGWLSEDNGAYVIGFEQSAQHALPDLTKVAPGDHLIVEQQPWVVSSVVAARVHAAAGELAFKPDFKNVYRLIEARNTQGEVLSLDFSELPPRRHVGRSVTFAALELTGLDDVSQPSQGKVAGQGMSCPNCGAALTPRLDTSKSITCESCRSVVDISGGLGQALAHYQQDNGDAPLVPMGTTGRLLVDGQVGDWQVVGYQERCDVPAPGSDDETTFWREYLLYNRQRGFAFLVDAEDGWSVVRPITGVPSLPGRGKASYQGADYREQYTYRARTTYVLGEFYWQVTRDQRSEVADYIGTGDQRDRRLSREQSPGEITWSAGKTLPADAVMKAFGLSQEPKARFERDVKPWSGAEQLPGWAGKLALIVVIILVIVILTRCDDDCRQVRDTYGQGSVEYQQCSRRAGGGGYYGGSNGGSSYGGYSSGGFHK